jgi:tRNA modification GTPase
MSLTSSSLTVCPLTPPGRGAVATIRIGGDLSTVDQAGCFVARNGAPLSAQKRDAIVFGEWRGVRLDIRSEEVVVCRTGDDHLELHCHGGSAAVERILNDLTAIGARKVTSTETPDFDARTLEGICRTALLRAPTERTALILLDQERVWRGEIERCRALQEGPVRRSRVEGIRKWSAFAAHLMAPWQVVLCGRPNVGKSSLMNALAGFARSIVHDVPGTTRDVVGFDTAFDGWPVHLSDTAGLRESVDPIEAEGVRRTQAAAAKADLVVLVVDASQPPTGEDVAIWSAAPLRAIRVANKADLPARLPEEWLGTAIPVSARTGEGLDRLIAAIIAELIPQVPSQDQALPFVPGLLDLLSATSAP